MEGGNLAGQDNVTVDVNNIKIIPSGMKLTQQGSIETLLTPPESPPVNVLLNAIPVRFHLWASGNEVPDTRHRCPERVDRAGSSNWQWDHSMRKSQRILPPTVCDECCGNLVPKLQKRGE